MPKQDLTVAQKALLTNKKMSYDDFAYSKRFTKSSTEKHIFEVTRFKPLKDWDTSAVSRLFLDQHINPKLKHLNFAVQTSAPLSVTTRLSKVTGDASVSEKTAKLHHDVLQDHVRALP